MKILIRHSDSAVMYAGDDIVLSEDRVAGAGWVDYSFCLGNSTVADASLPADFIGAAYSYSGGGWSVIDQARLDTVAADRDARIANLLPSAASAALARLAQERFYRETAGITVGGAQIKTDRESQALIIGAWCRAQQQPDVLIDWKGEGGWVQINAATVNAIADAVGAHVQACFSRERALAELINAAATVQEIAAIDLAAGWPA